MIRGRAMDGGRTAVERMVCVLFSSVCTSLRFCKGWSKQAMRDCVEGRLMGVGDAENSSLAWKWMGMAWFPNPASAVMVGSVSSKKARFLASWWKEVVMELLNAFRVRITVAGDWDRVASLAIFSALLFVFWKMSTIFSLISSSWCLWGCWVMNVDHLGEIMMYIVVLKGLENILVNMFVVLDLKIRSKFYA